MSVLYVGNKNYSSWSLRAWLALTWGKIAFETRVLPLGMSGYGKSQMPDICAASPSGRVPALDIGDGVTIWDSLAICEWAAEAAPALWPEAGLARAHARAAAAEMHAGFAALRREAPMNLRRRLKTAPMLSPDAQGDIARIEELWTMLRRKYGGEGPFLCGARSIADAFYAPIAARFRTYAVTLSPLAQAYCGTVLADAAFREWDAAAKDEPWAQPDIDEI